MTTSLHLPSPPAFRPTSPGVELAIVRRTADGGMTFFVRMTRGARAPHHDHPGGEETYMIEGTLRVGHRADADGHPLDDVVLTAGGYLFAPPHERHDGLAETDALFFVVAPGGVAPTTR
jgi:quercetin dioxygenase-like cupin family protein